MVPPANAATQDARRRVRGRRKLLAGLEPRFIGCALAGLVLPAVAIFLIVYFLGGGSSSSGNPTPTATVIDVSATSAAATSVALTSLPGETPEPTDTRAPTRTLLPIITPSPEPSPVLTATATATVTPTDTPPPTATPTATRQATPTPRPTRRPATPTTSSPQQYPAPSLLAPAGGAEFADADDVLLQWQPVGTLGANAYYVVTLSYLHSGTVWFDETPWTKGSSWLASEHSYLLDLSDDGVYTWSVRVMRQTGTDGGGRPTGTPLSPKSAERTFIWLRGGGGGGTSEPPPPTSTVPPPPP